MTLPETDAASPRFTAAAAIGYAWVMLRTRPVSFLRLALLQAVLFAAIGFALFWVMGRAGLAADLPPADQMAELAYAMIWIVPLYILMLVGSVWIESLWLDLFFNRSIRVWPGWADYGRLLLSFVIVSIVFMGGYLGFALIGGLLIGASAGLGGAGAAILVGMLVLAGFIAFLLLVQMRFTALPAIVWKSGAFAFAVGASWSLTKGRLGSLTLAWLGYVLLYLVLLIAVFIVFSLGPVNFTDGMRYALAEPNNPLAQYRMYTVLVTDAGAAAGMLVMLVATNLIFVPLMAVSRAIGVRLALEDEPA